MWRVAADAFVHPDAVRSGGFDVTVGAGCVIHPLATVVAEAGPVVLGAADARCLVDTQLTSLGRAGVVAVPPSLTARFT